MSTRAIAPIVGPSPAQVKRDVRGGSNEPPAPEIVERIKAIEIGRTARGKAKHLTNKEIAATVGISETQVREDLHGYKNVEKDAFVESREDIIDAEIIGDDELARALRASGHPRVSLPLSPAPKFPIPPPIV
ncbi:hypothetical protein ACTXPA_06075 [Glutamicibacter arilaitensis]|uniref:hypothetical protein n=1 Tax=Glutamicibacter arilaitensis TaxID=256701 RepID=UPI003FD198EC